LPHAWKVPNSISKKSQYRAWSYEYSKGLFKTNLFW